MPRKPQVPVAMVRVNLSVLQCSIWSRNRTPVCFTHIIKMIVSCSKSLKSQVWSTGSSSKTLSESQLKAPLWWQPLPAGRVTSCVSSRVWYRPLASRYFPECTLAVEMVQWGCADPHKPMGCTCALVAEQRWLSLVTSTSPSLTR